jgi:Rrf2 family protein
MAKGQCKFPKIATREKIPQRFLALILLKLKNHGVLLSRKGKGGGYFLRKSLDQISFGHVLRILEGPP